MSAAAGTPPHSLGLAPASALLPVRQELIDPAEKDAAARLCGLLRAPRAELYGKDQADLARLPTLPRNWMRRGEQLKVPAPGTNRKSSVSARIDLSEGWLSWFDHPKRSPEQFAVMLFACANRSERRGRLAVLLVENAPGHHVGKTGIVRRFLNALAGRVVTIFPPKYSMAPQPIERLFRQWRTTGTNHHTRGALEELLDDSGAWLGRAPASDARVPRILRLTVERLPFSMAAYMMPPYLHKEMPIIAAS